MGTKFLILDPRETVLGQFEIEADVAAIDAEDKEKGLIEVYVWPEGFELTSEEQEEKARQVREMLEQRRMWLRGRSDAS